MYESKFAFCLKVNGKVLREQNETTYVPFGSHYSLFLKNMNSLRALVHIEIDGEWIGADFIVEGNSSIDIERFVKEGNLKVGNKFKFIERTAAIEDGPRGIKVEDGLIRVEFEYEREPAPIKTYPPIIPCPQSPYQYSKDVWYSSPTTGDSPQLMGVNRCDAQAQGAVDYQNSATSSVASASSGTLRSMSVSNVGITAPGAVSNQTFQAAYFGLGDGVKHVMIMKILGKVGDAVVEQPVTVKHKPTCVTCGKVNKAINRFCSECGTSLSIV